MHQGVKLQGKKGRKKVHDIVYSDHAESKYDTETSKFNFMSFSYVKLFFMRNKKNFPDKDEATIVLISTTTVHNTRLGRPTGIQSKFHFRQSFRNLNTQISAPEAE